MNLDVAEDGTLSAEPGYYGYRWAIFISVTVVVLFWASMFLWLPWRIPVWALMAALVGLPILGCIGGMLVIAGAELVDWLTEKRK